MPTATLGQPFTFNVLFLDGDGAPVSVTAPMIQVFRFSSSGGKVVLTTTNMTAVSGDTGRYVYVYDVPSTLAEGDNLYALMYGTNPDTSDMMRVQEDVSLVAPATGGGIVARFIA